MEELTKPLSAEERLRYEQAKAFIRANLETCFKVGAQLTDIRDSKLYREDFPNFADFCQAEYGFSRSHAYRLIAASEVLESVDPSKNLSPIGDKIQAESIPIKKESQLRALAKVPKENRDEVLQVAATNGPVTAAKIAEAAKAVVPKPEVLDALGYPIPAEFHATWARRDEVQKMLSHISSVRGMLRTAQEENDVLWRPSAGPESQQSWSDLRTSLDKAYAQLSQSMPYAVCLVCHGRDSKMCGMCHGRGLISEFAYKHNFSDFDRKVRESQCRKPTQ